MRIFHCFQGVGGVALWFAIAATCLAIQTPTTDSQQIATRLAEYKSTHAAAAIDMLRQLIEMPNVSANQDDVRQNAEFIVDQFAKRGVSMQLLEAPAANPVVYGEIAVKGATRTVVIYVHYDGQPVNPARWTATAPFEPALFSASLASGGQKIDWDRATEQIDPEWRIYGRSASDDKAPLVALLTALDALAEFGLQPTSHIKFFFDGEEEIGSPNMSRFLTAHQDKFSDADLWVFCDGPLHQSRQPTLYYGVRGVTALEITVYGANRNLHSGHYGNWAPNPALELARLLASMKDAQGHIAIANFYDSVIPLTEAERAALAAVPDIDQQLRDELGLVETENENQPYLQRMQLPSLNIRGLESANVGSSARNVIPNQATASIDVRLVQGNHPEKMLDLIQRHIEAQGYFVVDREPTAQQRRKHRHLARITRKIGYPAARTRLDSPPVQPLVNSLGNFLDDPQRLLQIPSLGGSLPLYLITEGQRKPLVILPMANHDNNQHAPDENLRIGNLWYGIDAMTAILLMDD